MAYLGIDAGASATKWSLIDENKEVASGLLPAMDAHLYRESSLVRFEENFTNLLSNTNGFKIDSLILGITGLSDTENINANIRKFFQCRIKTMSDIELAYKAHFKTEQGILLYAGTGSVALTINNDGEVIKIGGWGYLLGDEGAGYWLGREAIRSALVALESRTPIKDGSLAHATLQAIGAKNWDGVKQFVYSKERSEIAQLATLVSELGERNELTAMEISSNAAAHLADLVTRTDVIIGNKSSHIVFTGGVSRSIGISNYLAREFEERFELGSEDIAKSAAELAQL